METITISAFPDVKQVPRVYRQNGLKNAGMRERRYAGVATANCGVKVRRLTQCELLLLTLTYTNPNPTILTNSTYPPPHTFSPALESRSLPIRR